MEPAKDMAATAAVTGAASFWASLKGVAFELLGVPLPVVLAAATGAFLARTFVQSTSYPKAVLAGIMWTLAGVFLSNLTLSLMGFKDAPTSILAGVALLISGLGQAIWPVLAAKVPAAVGRFLDGLFGGKRDDRGS